MSKFKVGDWVIHINPELGTIAHEYNNIPKQVLEIKDGLVSYRYPGRNSNTKAPEFVLKFAYKELNIKKVNDYLGVK